MVHYVPKFCGSWKAPGDSKAGLGNMFYFLICKTFYKMLYLDNSKHAYDNYKQSLVCAHVCVHNTDRECNYSGTRAQQLL